MLQCSPNFGTSALITICQLPSTNSCLTRNLLCAICLFSIQDVLHILGKHTATFDPSLRCDDAGIGPVAQGLLAFERQDQAIDASDINVNDFGWDTFRHFPAVIKNRIGAYGVLIADLEAYGFGALISRIQANNCLEPVGHAVQFEHDLGGCFAAKSSIEGYPVDNDWLAPKVPVILGCIAASPDVI